MTHYKVKDKKWKLLFDVHILSLSIDIILIIDEVLHLYTCSHFELQSW